MSVITDGSGAGYKARVDQQQRVHTFSTGQSLLASKAQTNQGFSLTSFGFLTDDTKNAVLYFKNNDPNVNLILAGITFALGQSDAEGAIVSRFHASPDSHTLTSLNSFPAASMLIGNAKTPVGTFLGANGGGQTVSSATEVPLLSVSSPGTFTPFLGPFVYPQGRDFAISLQAPAGNTSLEYSVTLSFYENGDIR